MKILFISILITAFSISIYGQNIVINEIMPKNVFTIFDEDIDNSDWIELYNTSNETLYLEGYSLTDDITQIKKWVFPYITLESESFLVLFTSGKDRKQTINYWETIINWGDVWKFKLGDNTISQDWKDLNFNDSGWREGPTGIGYGDNDDATLITSTKSVFARKKFNLSEFGNIILAVLHIDYDDGFAAYLNGIEIARSNLGEPGEYTPFDMSTNEVHEATIYAGGKPDGFYLNAFMDILNEDENILAIQVHNYNNQSSDLTLIPFFTIGLNEPPQNPNGTPGVLELRGHLLHTNFKISSTGESIYIFNKTSVLEDSVYITGLDSDISFGRKPDGSNNWMFFSEATPGFSNYTEGFLQKCSPPEITPEGSFFNSQITITIQNDNSQSEFFVTLDGSIPDKNSSKYNTPFTIYGTRVIRVIAYKDNYIPSDIVNKTYLKNEETELPVVSLITDPDNLWDFNDGIYVKGPNAEPDFPHYGANFWQDWEKPAHITFFELDKSSAFSVDCGIKIYGGWTRALAQKSLAVSARRKYGTANFEHYIFPDESIQSYKSFVLRNSGNDWEFSMMRDAMMQGLVSDLDLETQAYRPSVVFLNGKYWGIHNIREKVNEDFLASHHDIDPDSIDLLENKAEIREGSNDHYMAMLNFIEENDISIESNFSVVESMMEVDNFITYIISQIYFDNTDWPGNNIKFWRPQTDNGRWRWILYDTDFGFGIWNANAYKNNTLAFALEEHGTEWPNPAWSTFLLRKLLENDGFKNDFLNRFADLSGTNFKSSVVNDKIEELKSNIGPEMLRHTRNWTALSYYKWEDQINVLKNFADNRIVYLRNYFLSQFNLDGYIKVDLNVQPSDKGNIKINSICPDQYPWGTYYFKNVPIELTAIPKFGYKFVRWMGIEDSARKNISITPTVNDSITAVFEPIQTENIIVINEINYNSHPDYDSEDWIELYNNSEVEIDLGGWVFSDSNDSNLFVFNESTILQPYDYLVLSSDTSSFKGFFPDVINVIGNFDFKLSNGGEKIRLFNSEGDIVDSLTYDDEAPWSTEPDGSGNTLSLLNPNLDNSLPENWKASNEYGTPGYKNDVFITQAEEEDDLIPEFRLYQNYPNPFNPSTVISFSLAELTKVKLELFNILGERVETLVETYLPSGFHTFKFQADNLSSGVYIYKLDAGKFKSSKKMILIR
ncbi:CotH kinase family protein [Bacteroidota bacterium]